MDTQSSLGDILNSLMQNPEIMKTVLSLTKEDSADSEKPEDSAPKAEENEADSGFSIPPEILSKLPQMMSALSGMGSPMKKGGEDSSSNARRKALLLSLKPFLSEKRCSVIDGLLQFEGLYGVLDSFKGK